MNRVFLSTRPFNTVRPEPVEGRNSLGFDELSPNGIPVINKAGLIPLLGSHGRQNGVALITVLLVLALATVSVVSMSSERQLDIRRTENQLRNDQAWVYVQSLESWALQQLQANEAADFAGIRMDEVGAVQLHGALDELQGKINLNNLLVEGEPSQEDVRRLQRLLKQLKLPVELTDAMLDWLDADSDMRYPAGAEDDLYTRLNPPYRSGNRQFGDVSELLLVKGVTPQIFQALQPYVTAVDGYVPINVNTARPEILRCLADDLSKDRAESIYRAAGKPFAKLESFLQDEAVNDSGIGKYGLSVTSRHYVLAGTVDMGKIKMQFESYLSKDKAGKASLIRRGRNGWQHG